VLASRSHGAPRPATLITAGCDSDVLEDPHPNREVVGEAVLVDGFAHPSERARTAVGASSHTVEAQYLHRGGSTAMGARAAAMFLLIKNWSSMLGWLSK
jgi:hypothetical protein